MTSSKRFVGAAIVGFVLATLFSKLDGTAEGCNILDKPAWMVLEALRPVIRILANWQAVSAYPGEHSGFLQHWLQIGASIWPLVCITVC